ncbi:embryo defective 1923 [Striga hermonthica]|uniref:Embryo defective 1923 n=1 Tax=Striga hermonthica TaxID=68872 RepID=A0A9N7R8H9_STRHE|nr:embryo defective 1923 [Striga hermonthica]
MSTTLSALHCKTPIKLFSPNISPRINHSSHSLSLAPSLTPANANHLKRIRNPQNLYGPFKEHFFEFQVVKSSRFAAKAQYGTESSGNTEKEEVQYVGESSMPERFRYLTKEVPAKPLRWPWFIALAFMTYAWRAVLWELFNWKRALSAIGRFLGYISKIILALVFSFIGDPLTFSIRAIETSLYTVRAFYSSIIWHAPVPELATIVMLTSAVLAVAETAVPDSIDSQPYMLTLAGLIGFAAVKNYINELFFWTLLVGLFGFNSFVKKRDYVSSALPVAAVLVAVGEPWVRVVAMGSYLGLAVFYRSRRPVDLKEDGDGGVRRKRVPLPLLCAGLAIGVRVAANWAGYRHLTWMIV